MPFECSCRGRSFFLLFFRFCLDSYCQTVYNENRGCRQRHIQLWRGRNLINGANMFAYVPFVFQSKCLQDYSTPLSEIYFSLFLFVFTRGISPKGSDRLAANGYPFVLWTFPLLGEFPRWINGLSKALKSLVDLRAFIIQVNYLT